MRHALAASLLAATLVVGPAGCYAARGGPAPAPVPASGVWHLECNGDGGESQDYRIAFLQNGAVIVYDGEVRHDIDGRKITNNTTEILSSNLFDHRSSWQQGKVVLHTLQELSGRGFLAAREYTFSVQDPHTMVGQVVSTTRTNGIYTRSTYPAIAHYVKDAN